LFHILTFETLQSSVSSYIKCKTTYLKRKKKHNKKFENNLWFIKQINIKTSELASGKDNNRFQRSNYERESECIGLLTALPLASNRLMNK